MAELILYLALGLPKRLYSFNETTEQQHYYYAAVKWRYLQNIVMVEADRGGRYDSTNKSPITILCTNNHHQELLVLLYHDN